MLLFVRDLEPLEEEEEEGGRPPADSILKGKSKTPLQHRKEEDGVGRRKEELRHRLSSLLVFLPLPDFLLEGRGLEGRRGRRRRRRRRSLTGAPQRASGEEEEGSGCSSLASSAVSWREVDGLLCLMAPH